MQAENTSRQQQTPRALSRRNFFDRVGTGLQGAALASLLSADLYGDEPESSRQERPVGLEAREPHHQPAARSVIQLFMHGGPSQMDLFDPKPELQKRHGESYFDKIAGEVENPAAAGALFKSPFKFSKHGASGMDFSELQPHLSRQADDIALIRSMQTTNLTHEPALWKISCGRMLTGLPTLGAWITYGLGTENRNLPAYVVLDDPKGLPVNHHQNWQSGFLSPLYQGTRFRSTGSPILNLKPEFKEPVGITTEERDLIARLDQIHKSRRPAQPQLGARISSYELAARMQLEASDALDINRENKQTREMYGIGQDPTDSYGKRCLIARRLVERGVRFVQLFLEFQVWDHHTQIFKGLRSACARTDQPIAALLRDLKDRGLLDSTLVVWGGEFGRLPIAQLGDNKSEKNAGRDHNKNAMCTWMAGGGIKGGSIHGATDELGFSAARDRVTVQDWHATILHQLGLHHEKLTYNRNGFEEKLTGTFEARVIRNILA